MFKTQTAEPYTLGKKSRITATIDLQHFQVNSEAVLYKHFYPQEKKKISFLKLTNLKAMEDSSVGFLCTK